MMFIDFDLQQPYGIHIHLRVNGNRKFLDIKEQLKNRLGIWIPELAGVDVKLMMMSICLQGEQHQIDDQKTPLDFAPDKSVTMAVKVRVTIPISRRSVD